MDGSTAKIKATINCRIVLMAPIYKTYSIELVKRINERINESMCSNKLGKNFRKYQLLFDVLSSSMTNPMNHIVVKD